MELPFPSYKATFTCDLPMYEVTKNIQECVFRNQRDFKIKKEELNSTKSFLIETYTGAGMYSYTSLLNVELKPLTNKKTEVSMLFKMKTFMKILSSFFFIVWFFILLNMIVISFKNSQPLTFDYFSVPLFLIALLVFTNIVALRITSKTKFKIFLKEFGFNPKDKQNSPKLEWVKIFGSKNKH